MMFLAHVTPVELPFTTALFAVGVVTGVVLSWAWRQMRSSDKSEAV